MTKNKHSRIAKLEAKANIIGERHKVIPHCSFYHTKERDCECVPYFTRTPRVILSGLGEFYKQVDKCQIPPADAELILDYYDEKEIA